MGLEAVKRRAILCLAKRDSICRTQSMTFLQLAGIGAIGGRWKSGYRAPKHGNSSSLALWERKNTCTIPTLSQNRVVTHQNLEFGLFLNGRGWRTILELFCSARHEEFRSAESRTRPTRNRDRPQLREGMGIMSPISPNYRVSLQGFTPVSCPRFSTHSKALSHLEAAVPSSASRPA